MYKRRIKIFLLTIGLVFVGILARLVHLQIVQGDEFRTTAESKLKRPEILPASRGQIMDRNGRILAVDEPCFDFCLDYGLMASDKAWIAARKKQIKAAARPAKLSAAEVDAIFDRRVANTWRVADEAARAGGEDIDLLARKIVERIQKISRARGVDIREQRQAHAVLTGLDEAAATHIREMLDGTIGAAVTPGCKRWYPFGDAACHIIGVTGQPDAEDLERHNAEFADADWIARARNDYGDGDLIGQSGVEKMCEDILRGRRGYRQVKHGGQVLEESPSEAGKDVHLTIDIELQRQLTELYKARKISGCVVVLSLPRGEVLAMVSAPTYDLNTYRRQYPQLVEDTLNLPLLNRSIARHYPPGSTAKPPVGLAALGEGVLRVGTSYNCKGYLFGPAEPPRDPIFRTNGIGHGALDIAAALKVSCNVFFANCGNQLGPTALCRWLRLFGYGERPGTGLPEENAGGLPGESHRFGHGDAWNMGIGQGLFTATPLQVANAIATVARGGEFLSPVLTLEGGPQRVRRTLPLTREQIQIVQEGMRRVVNDRGGTAFNVFHEDPREALDIIIAGKTGTATLSPQRADLNHDGIIEEDEMKTGDMAWFAGFAPYSRPQIALAVVVEFVEGGGAKNAGPLARETVRLCKLLGYIE